MPPSLLLSGIIGHSGRRNGFGFGSAGGKGRSAEAWVDRHQSSCCHEGPRRSAACAEDTRSRAGVYLAELGSERQFPHASRAKDFRELARAYHACAVFGFPILEGYAARRAEDAHEVLKVLSLSVAAAFFTERVSNPSLIIWWEWRAEEVRSWYRGRCRGSRCAGWRGRRRGVSCSSLGCCCALGLGFGSRFGSILTAVTLATINASIASITRRAAGILALASAASAFPFVARGSWGVTDTGPLLALPDKGVIGAGHRGVESWCL